MGIGDWELHLINYQGGIAFINKDGHSLSVVTNKKNLLQTD